MSKTCELSGVKPQFGNNVSHSERKTRRKFVPNLQRVTLHSDKLATSFRFRITAKAIKSVEANGGLDNYLIKASKDQLSLNAKKIKQKIAKAIAE